MNLKPFFSYYGGKWRAAPHYPAPKYDTIVEPFAGSAGYSLRYADRRVWLNDKDEIICGVWDYLIHAPSSEILALPEQVAHVDELRVSQEAKWLIGFWLNKGAASPCKTPSSWMRKGTHTNSFWGTAIKNRIANQQEHIRHWKIFNISYSNLALNCKATWYVDPPYIGAGKFYRHSSNGIDYDHLGAWCRGIRGHVIVCENEGADWLPFSNVMHVKAMAGRKRKGISAEVIYEHELD
jgi:site-specific DNA-adenine methylase